jgi:hypothetical protein
LSYPQQHFFYREQRQRHGRGHERRGPGRDAACEHSEQQQGGRVRVSGARDGWGGEGARVGGGGDGDGGWCVAVDLGVVALL